MSNPQYRVVFKTGQTAGYPWEIQKSEDDKHCIFFTIPGEYHHTKGEAVSVIGKKYDKTYTPQKGNYFRT